jgi:hypothetical protein
MKGKKLRWVEKGGRKGIEQGKTVFNLKSTTLIIVKKYGNQECFVAYDF